MIPLDDPIWAELPDGNRSRKVAGRLRGLLGHWRKDEAFDLAHALTVHERPSPAAIAALPHLLRAAEGQCGKRAAAAASDMIAEILTFRSAVIARRTAGAACPEPVKGAWARPVKGWEDGLEPDLARRLSADLAACLPAAQACLLAALPGAKDETATRLLAGLAAAAEEHVVARALDFGIDGILRCRACKDGLLWLAFPDCVALYTVWDEGRRSPEMRDLEDGEPNRARGGMTPHAGIGLAPGAEIVWKAASDLAAPEPFQVTRHMLGEVPCPRCGVSEAPLLV